MSDSPPVLYHFTCAHGHAGIQASHILRPSPHPFLPGLGPLLWLTDLADPTPESVGLTSEWQTCDRRAYRYVVRTKAAVAWSAIRGKAPAAVVRDMESFGAPEHWWVARRPVLPSEFARDTTWRMPVAVAGGAQ